jgi:hypothetical protein
VLVFALITALTLTASPDDKKEAGTHYQRAVSLYKDGDFKAALAEFRTAYEVLPSYEVLFNIALCERRLFNYARAMRTLDQYLMEGGVRIAPDRREAVQREVTAIKVLTAPVAVIVEGPIATVSVDGEKVGDTPLQDLVLLGIGKHKVRAECQGCSVDERTIDVRGGQAMSVQLAVASLTEPVDVSVECTPENTTIAADGALELPCPTTLSLKPGNHEFVGRATGYIAQRTEVLVQPGQPRKVTLTLVELPPAPPPFPVLGVTLMGSGVVLGGVGIAFATMASANAQRTTNLVRAGGPWDATAVANEQVGHRNSLIAWSLLSAGGAALATGIVALVFQVTHHQEKPVKVSLFPAPGGFAACASF